MKRIALTLVLAAGLVAAALAFAERADAHAAAGVPYHSSAGAWCYTDPYTGPSVRIYPARSMQPTYLTTDWRYMENVTWRADLFRWNGSSWQLWNTSQPTLHGIANYYGLQALNGSIWFSRPGGALGTGVQWLRFGNLAPGHYAVRETYGWQNGVKHSDFASFTWNNTTSQICTLS